MGESNKNEAKMSFSFVTIYVDDMDKALGFYQGLLDLPLLRRSPIQDGEMVFLGTETGAQLEIISSLGQQSSYSGFSLGITVDSLEQTSQKLIAAGYPLLRGPISPSPVVSFSFFRDPFGIEVELIEHC